MCTQAQCGEELGQDSRGGVRNLSDSKVKRKGLRQEELRKQPGMKTSTKAWCEKLHPTPLQPPRDEQFPSYSP